MLQRSEVITGGGTAGNERLTAMTGATLIAVLAAVGARAVVRRTQRSVDLAHGSDRRRRDPGDRADSPILGVDPLAAAQARQTA